MKKILTLVLLITATASFAQQDMLFTHYMYNKMALNPACAGSRELFGMELITRFQWVGISGAPRTISFTANTPLKNPHIGIGFLALRDELGPMVDYGVMGTFAYRILFPTSRLSFGIQAGIKYVDIDWVALKPKTAGDIELVNQAQNKVVPDVDFGIYYYGQMFYAGFSSRHLLQNQVMVSRATPDGTTSFTRLMRHFYGMAGMVFRLSDNLVFTPSVLAKYVQNVPFQADFTASFTMYDILTLGASYRTESAIGLMAEVNITKNISAGYSYDIWFNDLMKNNSGSHEIRIGVNLDLFDKNRMMPPRYF
jgi:type IX secretion system PorP/SprF family membrane protein